VEHSTRHTVIFMTVLCIVFSVLVSAVAVGLHDRQVENQRLDRIKNVLVVADLMKPGESLAREEINRRFEESLEARLVDLQTGSYVEGADPFAYDQQKATKDPATSREAPDNKAKIRRVPDQAVIYLIKKEGVVEGIVLPIEGQGLWSTLYGYLALEPDTRTVKGITYFSHGETPGLGGEVDNPRWKGLFPGRLALDDSYEPALSLKKGIAGSVKSDPYHVDGLSGATITSNGVTNMLHFWLGKDGFGGYLAEVRNREGGTG
jgi:Na+-transporting NADH:ubiquinone oxidoreductase subunit C